MGILKENTPLIAVSISFIALIATIFGVILSRRSLIINYKQFKAKLSNFEFYVIDSYCVTFEEERLLIFHITVSNKSETKNTFILTLYLEYYNNEDKSTKMKLQHSLELSKKILRQTFTFFPKEIFLSDKECISKWLIFGYKTEITKGKRIDNYTLNLRDVNGNQYEVSTMLMKELL